MTILKKESMPSTILLQIINDEFRIMNVRRNSFNGSSFLIKKIPPKEEFSP